MRQQKLPDRVRITCVSDLNDAIARGNKGYAIVLAGGLAFSRKTISRKGKKYLIRNHIDESVQVLSVKELMDEDCTHIGVAMKRGALFTLDY